MVNRRLVVKSRARMEDDRNTINKLFHLKGLPAATVKVNKALGHYDLRNTMYGLEIEVEHLDQTNYPAPYIAIEEMSKNRFEGVKVFWIEEEASLKEIGMEFISYPIHLKNIPEYLNFIFPAIRHVFKNAEFTNRCSIHVHQSVGELQMFEVSNLYKIYSIFEDALFEFAGNNRKDNPFCRPVRNTSAESFLPTTKEYDPMNFAIPDVEQVKYSAFNVAPIVKQGTVEYRILPGTWDIDKIFDFVTMLDSFKETAKKESWENLNDMILKINTISNYLEFIKLVFKDNERLIPLLFPTSNFKSIEDGVTTAKRIILGSQEHLNIRLSKAMGNKTIETLLIYIEQENENKGKMNAGIFNGLRPLRVR